MAVEFSFSSKEILKPGDPIYITFSQLIGETLLKPKIHLLHRGRQLNIAICVHGPVVEISTHSLESDLYTIQVGRVVDSAGHLIIPYPASRAVVIRRFNAKIPKDLRLEHVVHLAVGEFGTQRLRPGEEAPKGTNYLSRVKAVHTKTGVPQNLGFDARGQQVDAEEIINAVENRRFAKFGRIHEHLWDELENATDSVNFEVEIWPMLEFDPSVLRKSRHDIKAPSSKQTVHDTFREPKARLISSIKDLGVEVEDQSSNSVLPSFVATLTTAQIRQIAKSEDAGIIFLHSKDRVPNGRTLATSMAVSRGDAALLLGHAGEKINVAIWGEKGPTDVTNLVYADQYNPNGTNTPLQLTHTRVISGLIKNIEPNQPHGYAPDCILYNANDGTNDSLTWACTTKKCTVISTTSHITAEQENGTLSSFDLKQDYLTSIDPHPLFVNAAGEPIPFPKTPSTDFVNHKGYNAIGVGASELNLARRPAVPVWSDFKNPTSPHNDRELPELVAPGVHITALGETVIGTSFASPAVAGTAAVLQSTHPGLLNHPEGVRAILLAGAGSRNITDTTWLSQILSGTDGNAGAGPLDAQASVKIAQHFYNPAPRVPPASSGWSTGVVTPPTNFDPNTKLFNTRYLIKTPSALPTPATPPAPGTPDPKLTLRATLAYSSKISSASGTPTINTATSVLTVNLDLVLFDAGGNKGAASVQVAQSATFDNSYEIIDFEGAGVGKTYSLAVRWASGVDFCFYGVAWCCFLGGVVVG